MVHVQIAFGKCLRPSQHRIIKKSVLSPNSFASSPHSHLQPAVALSKSSPVISGVSAIFVCHRSLGAFERNIEVWS